MRISSHIPAAWALLVGLFLNPHSCQTLITKQTKDALWWLYYTECPNFFFVWPSPLPAIPVKLFQKEIRHRYLICWAVTLSAFFLPRLLWAQNNDEEFDRFISKKCKMLFFYSRVSTAGCRMFTRLLWVLSDHSYIASSVEGIRYVLWNSNSFSTVKCCSSVTTFEELLFYLSVLVKGAYSKEQFSLILVFHFTGKLWTENMKRF